MTQRASIAILPEGLSSWQKVKRMAKAAHDPEHEMTAADLAALRGPYLCRPGTGASAAEWLRWVREVSAAAPLAQQLVDAAIGAAAKVTR